jgi:hypothetical protein
VTISVRVLALLACATFALAGCTPIPDEPGADVAPETGVLESAPAPEFIPELIEGGSALENQPFIDYVVRGALENPENKRAGLSVAEALQAVGFSTEVLELTPDNSLIQLPVDSVTIAVRFEDECVLAQWGPDWYVSQVEPLLVTERCLVGETVSLD